MRIVWLLLASSQLVTAQPDEHAQALLRDAAALAKSATGWHAEGKTLTQLDGPAGSRTVESQFTIDFDRTRARLESNGGSGHSIQICDGIMQSLWWPDTGKISKTESSATDNCSYPLTDWETVADHPELAALIGSDQITLDGQLRTCQDLRADTRRTVCIDPITNLILRYRTETDLGEKGKLIQTTIVSSLKENPEFNVWLFLVETPVSKATAEGLSGVSATRVAAPKPLVFPEPKYSEKARKAHIEGEVLLYIEVPPNGVPQNIKVLRSLGHGLDEEAIACVKQWRFSPGLKHGEPVTVTAQVAIHFRLQPDPPAVAK